VARGSPQFMDAPILNQALSPISVAPKEPLASSVTDGEGVPVFDPPPVFVEQEPEPVTGPAEPPELVTPAKRGKKKG